MEVDSNASNKAICNSVNSFYTASLLSLAWIVTSSRLAIPHTTKWEFDKHGATLRNNNNGDNLFTLHLPLSNWIRNLPLRDGEINEIRRNAADSLWVT